MNQLDTFYMKSPIFVGSMTIFHHFPIVFGMFFFHHGNPLNQKDRSSVRHRLEAHELPADDGSQGTAWFCTSMVLLGGFNHGVNHEWMIFHFIYIYICILCIYIYIYMGIYIYSMIFHDIPSIISRIPYMARIP